MSSIPQGWVKVGVHQGRDVYGKPKAGQPVQQPQRIRQETKPTLSKFEQEWFDVLTAAAAHKRMLVDVLLHYTASGSGLLSASKDAYVKIENLRGQARRYKLANGAWYKPDVTGTVDGRETAWECKGDKSMKGVAKGLLALKVAAHQWPEVRWILVWKEHGQWRQQEVRP